MWYNSNNITGVPIPTLYEFRMLLCGNRMSSVIYDFQHKQFQLQNIHGLLH